jgi:hypothetical protein
MPGGDDGEDALYDAYLDACLSGAPPTPATFLANVPDASERLRKQIESAYVLALERAGRDTTSNTLPFQTLGGYAIKERLGLGGMGTVYLAEQSSLGRTVALKVIRSDLRDSETILKRFEREAHAVARLRHRNIVNVHEFGRDGEWDYIAMELVPGQSLDVVLRDSPPEPSQVLEWGVELAEALAHAHEQGVVHRDVKPANIMITPAGRPVLLDFGLARMTGTEATRLTTGFAGTPQYAAPEQLIDDGDDVGGRTDIYALGVTLYEALTGQLPYESGRVEELLLRILREEPTPPRRVNPALSVDVETVILKMMEKEPARRYDSGWAAAADIKRLLNVQPVHAKRPGPWTITRKWMRRRPVVATVVAAVLLGACTWVGVSIKNMLEDRAVARQLVSEARELVSALRTARLEIRPEERALREEEAALRTRYHAPEEVEAFEQRVDLVAAYRREREAQAYRVQDLLRQAQRLHDAVAGTEEVQAALFLERVEAARISGDTTLEGHYRRQLADVDPEGTRRAALESKGLVHLQTAPPGASVHLFRFDILRERAPGAERRLVPVPVLPPGKVLPTGVVLGAPSLRVIRGAGEIRQGDVILSVLGHPGHDGVYAASDGEVIRRGDRLVRADDRPIRGLWDVDPARLVEVRSLTYEREGKPFEVLAADRDVPFIDARGLVTQGGIRASVYTQEQVRTVQLPAGLGVRPTCAPRYLMASASVGTTPLEQPLVLSPGSYLLVVRREGYEEALVAVSVEPGSVIDRRVELFPTGTTPPGFVYVAGDAGIGDGTARPEGDHSFWIQERELTTLEFLPFLNDRGRWHACGAVPEYQDVRPPAFRPDFAASQVEAGLVKAVTDGSFILASQDVAGLPVRNLTWEEAHAFARWCSLRYGGVFALPNMDEWMRAAGDDGRAYPFGNDFRPTWVRSLVARPGPAGSYEFEPSARFPRDESSMGVYAMAGNVAEFLDHAWGEASVGVKYYAGGSAADARAGLFRLESGRGAFKRNRVAWVGLRLVIRKLPPDDS